MPTLTVTTTTNYRVAPFDAQVNGQNITALTFNTIATTTAEFSSTQFGGSSISNALFITGDTLSYSILAVYVASGTSFSASGWNFIANWAPGTTTSSDRISLVGAAGSETITGSVVEDMITGAGGSDSMVGGGGNDAFLYTDPGEIGSDTIDGGVGTFDVIRIVGPSNIYDFRDASISGIEYMSETGVDVSVGFRVSNTQVGSGKIIGFFGGLTGGLPDDVVSIIGGSIDASTLVLTNLLGTELIGGAAADTIIGSDLSDTIAGEAGLDSLVGGLGDDRFSISAMGDAPAGETIDGGGGTADRLDVSIVGTTDLQGLLISNVEVLSATYVSSQTLVLAGSQIGSAAGRINQVLGNTNISGNVDDSIIVNGPLVNLTGVSLSNVLDVTINGTSNVATDSLTGSSDADRIFGFGGNDSLVGGGGADLLDGGTGTDTMVGGNGSDVYYFDFRFDVVTETNADTLTGGIDSVYASANHILGANVEQLLLTPGATTGTGNSDANSLFATLLFTGATLSGAGGNDVLYGSNYADSLDGGADIDILIGYYATGGADTMAGGSGNDVYYVFDNAQIIENSGEGTDTLYAQVNLTMAAETEQLILYGVATQGTGNASANNLFANNSTNSLTLDGAAGNDWLIGSNQADTLRGGADNDILQGLGGANRMEGGTGNDIHYSTSSSDVIIENVGEGLDTLYANYLVSVLADNVEQLVIFGGATHGFGNTLANTIYANNNTNGAQLSGGSGSDLIYGSAFADSIHGDLGNDTLVGGNGNDNFLLFAGSSGGADLITDFADGADRFNLSFSASHGYSAASIGSSILISGGANALITFASGTLAGLTITLQGVNQSNITAADFTF